MRKLLLFFAMLCVSIGAWAEQVSFGSEGSWYEIDGTTLTIHVGKNHDLGNHSEAVLNSIGDAKNGITKIVYDKNSNMSGSDATNTFVNQFPSVETIDLSGVTLEGADVSYYFGSYTNVKSLIMADVTADKTIEIQGNTALQAVLVTPTSQTTVKFSGNNSDNAGIIINGKVTKDGSFAHKWIGEISSYQTYNQDFSQNATTVTANKLVVTGTMAREDAQYVSLLTSLSEDIRLLDMSAVTLSSSPDGYNFQFGTNPKLYSVVLPKDLNDVQGWWFEGCTNLYAAISYTTDKNALRAYVKQPGRLKNTLLDFCKSSGEIGTAWDWSGMAGLSLSATFKKVKLSGNLNAIDISRNDEVLFDENGNLGLSHEEKEEASDSRTNTGTKLCVALPGRLIEELDLSDAYFPVYTDMTLSKLGYGTTNDGKLSKVMLPTDSRMNTVPAFMFNSGFPDLNEICIPANYEIIKSGAFARNNQGFQHIWTTDTNPNTTVDNGVMASDGEIYYGYDATDGGKTIDASGGKWGSYTFSSNLKLIESYAFAQPKVNIKDVYVLAVNAPECHVDAFNMSMYVGQSGFGGSPSGGIVTRDAYKNGDTYITMLHYPRDCDAPHIQRYTDMGREYSIATGEVDGKGANIYFPSYSEFLRAYIQGTTGYLWNSMNDTRQFGELIYNPANDNSAWSASKQASVNAYVSQHPGTYTSGTKAFSDAIFYDVTLGDNTKPADMKDYWNVTYGTTALYPQAEVNCATATPGSAVTGTDGNGDGMITSRDYRGWHQFVLTSFAANTELEVTQHRSYLSDNDWWTICLPYDLTYSEMMFFYGTVTTDDAGNISMDETKVPYLSQLVSVTRDMEAGKITLNFSKNLMNHSQVKNDAGDWVIGDDEDTSIKSEDKVVLHAGVPYMIRPYRTAASGGSFTTQFDIYGDSEVDEAFSGWRAAIKSKSLYDKLVAAQALGGSDQMTMVKNGLVTVPALVVNADATGAKYTESTEGTVTIGTKEYNKSSEFDYTFVGSFYKSFLPPYSYYLGYKNGACFFYADIERTAETTDDEKTIYPDLYNTMNWNNNTCIIVPNMLNSTLSKTYNLGLGQHKGEVTPASGSGDKIVPAQWVIGVNGTTTTSVRDDLKAKSGTTGAKSYTMVFGVEQGEIVTGISEVNTNTVSANDDKIYTIDGQQINGSSLPKGLYIKNGKKIIVK